MKSWIISAVLLFAGSIPATAQRGESAQPLLSFRPDSTWKITKQQLLARINQTGRPQEAHTIPNAYRPEADLSVPIPALRIQGKHNAPMPNALSEKSMPKDHFPDIKLRMTRPQGDSAAQND